MPPDRTKPMPRRVVRSKYTASQRKKHAHKRKKQAIVKNLQLIFERYRKKTRKKNKKKKPSLDILLEKYKGKEDLLYKKVCEKYGVDPNPELLPQARPKIKTRSKKRGIEYTWVSRIEVLEEVILTYQYSIEQKKGNKADKLNPLAVDKLLNTIIEFAGPSERPNRAQMRTPISHDDPRSTLFLQKPSEQELDEIWSHTAPNNQVNDEEFLVLIKNLVTVSRNHVLKQISRQKLATQHYRRQNENNETDEDPHFDKDGDYSERSDSDRFSDLWEAESSDQSSHSARSRSVTSSNSSMRSLQELMLSIEEEEEFLQQRLKEAMKDDDRKSLSDISSEAPAVGSQTLSVEAGQIAVRCNRILGALMVDRERFSNHIKGISNTITRENFYELLQEILPNLSHELMEIQKHVPRRRASQGEGLRWQPPVSPLKRGDVQVKVLFEFSDLFKTELREQHRLSKQVENTLGDSVFSPASIFSRKREAKSPNITPTKDNVGHLNYDLSLPLPLPKTSKRSLSLPRKGCKKKGKIRRAMTLDPPLPPFDLNSPILITTDDDDSPIGTPPITNDSHDIDPTLLPTLPAFNTEKLYEEDFKLRDRNDSFTDLPDVPSGNMRMDLSRLRAASFNPSYDMLLSQFMQYVPKMQCLHLCDLIHEFLTESDDQIYQSEQIIVDDAPMDDDQWDFAPIALRIAEGSNVRQVLEYTFTLLPALQSCEPRLQLLVMRSKMLITLDRESRFELQASDEISILEDFHLN